jgi:signal transduction histidine kinase
MGQSLENIPDIDISSTLGAIRVNHGDGSLLKRDLLERVKELNCLYGISRLMENRDISLDRILESVVELIPQAWQFPEAAAARIAFKRKKFQTSNFVETQWCQKEKILTNGTGTGYLTICYLEEKPDSGEGPFLKEEKTLVHVLAQRIGNIIEQKTAEKRLQVLYRREINLRKKLQKEILNRADFSRKLIHELKTPLTSLMATSQYLYLLQQSRDIELGKAAGLVWEGANRLNNRIEELHDVVKGEFGTLKIETSTVPVMQLVGSIVDETDVFVRDHGLNISIDASLPLPDVACDSEKIGQVMLNLINNACKYAASGKYIIIEVTRDSSSTVKIGVKDFGLGISREQQKTLFKPGYQVSHGRGSAGGLGIGLTLCKILVNLQGGKIWVESKVGKGSTFFFTLPVAGGPNG